MTNEDYEMKFQELKKSLPNNLAIYHERVTLLIELTEFEILETRVNFKAKVIKPLDFEQAQKIPLYEVITLKLKNELSFGTSYLFGEKDIYPPLKGTKIGRPYCPFILWLDPELTKFVQENEDEITKLIPRYILWGEDWTVVKQKTKI